MQNAHASTDGNGHVRLRRRTTRTRRDCDNLLTRLGHGDITVKPGIQRYDGNLVTFTDGSSVEAVVVVYCTGSRICFPFLDHAGEWAFGTSKWASAPSGRADQTPPWWK